MTPRQFTSARIAQPDVQHLLHKVRTLRDDEFTRRYPQETPCRVVIELNNNRSLDCETTDWLGFFKRPMSWSQVRQKFDALVAAHTNATQRDEIARLVSNLDDSPVRALTRSLGQCTPTATVEFRSAVSAAPA